MKKVISFLVLFINIWIAYCVPVSAYETVILEIRQNEKVQNEQKSNKKNGYISKEINENYKTNLEVYDNKIQGYYINKNKEIKVYIDEKDVKFDVPPQIINGRTMVPLRAIFEAIGADVNWDDKTKTITIEKEEKSYVMKIGENIITIGNSYVIMDTYPTIIDNRTLVPVRFIAECLGYTVNWDDNNRVVTVDTKNQSEIDLYKLYVNNSFAMLCPDDLIVDESFMDQDVIFMNNADYNIPGEKEIISISGLEYDGRVFLDLIEEWNEHIKYKRKAQIISVGQSKLKGCTLYKIEYIDEGDYITSCFIEGGKKAYNVSFISDNQEKFKDEVDKILSTLNIL